jgi:hypothetical protein
MTAIPTDLQRGDLLQIEWADIYEDATGNPDTARLSKRVSYGLFWHRAVDRGLPVFITTTTLDDDVSAQSGYCIYPEAVITKVHVVRRVRRPRVRVRAAGVVAKAAEPDV